MRLTVEGEGPLVLKIAGLVGGAGLYWEEMEAARQAGFRVAQVDTAGDRHDDPAPCPLSWDFLSAEVGRALDQLDARRAVLWGTSFGSLVALATAARADPRITGLLLCFPPPPDWSPALYRRLLRWTGTRPRPDRAAARLFQVGFLTLNAWEFARPGALARLPRLARASREAATPSSTIRHKLGLLFEDHPGLPAPDRRLPCSIIAAAWDTVAPIGGARRLATALPGARLRVLPRAGHSGAFAHARVYTSWAIEELGRLTSSAED